MNQSPYPPGLNDPSRRPPGALMLAATGAWMASGFWLLVILLLRANLVASHYPASIRLWVPGGLAALYAVRGYQMFMGSVETAQRMVWYLGLGAVYAFLQMLSGVPIIVVLNGLRVAVNVFGAVMAWRAIR